MAEVFPVCSMAEVFPVCSMAEVFPTRLEFHDSMVQLT